MFRLFFIVILVSSLLVSAYYRRRARREGEVIPRTQESRPLVVGRLLVGLPLAASLLAYAVSPRTMAWAEAPVPGWLRWVGAVTGALNVGLISWVLSSLGANVSETVLTKRNHTLVTHGPYRWVRHPLYTAGVLGLASLSLLAANWFLALMVLVVIAILPLLVHKEETYLIEKFGGEYREYADCTGRFLPRPNHR